MIIIYDKNDLIDSSKNKNIREIDYTDIRFSIQMVQIAQVVIFVDQNRGLLRVLKHRFIKDIDTAGVYDSKELAAIIEGSFPITPGLGKSILKPGTREKRS